MISGKFIGRVVTGYLISYCACRLLFAHADKKQRKAN
jgi:hypothetical protein